MKRWCKVFASTLTKKATTWMGRLPHDNIHSWKEFKKIFLAEFKAAGIVMKDETYLFKMRQKIGESNYSYITHFKKSLDFVKVIEEKSVIMCFVGGLHFGPLKIELMLRGPKNRVDMSMVNQKMASAKESNEERGSSRSRKGKEKVKDDCEEKRVASKGTDRSTSNDRGGNNGRARVENFTPLNATREHIISVMMKNNQFEPPRP